MNNAADTGPLGVTLFLCGDVMTGRGIDQILPHPSRPHLFEPYMRSALDYVETGRARERADSERRWTSPTSGAMRWRSSERVRPHARIINLETAVTAAEDAWAGKGINYRMHPGERCLPRGAGIDCCVLANNHVLDWGYRGLERNARHAARSGHPDGGAGRDADRGCRAGGHRCPARAACWSSLSVWQAAACRANGQRPATAPGVNFLDELSEQAVDEIATARSAPPSARATSWWSRSTGAATGATTSRREQRDFAHRLIDAAGVDLVHGHSSHHAKGIEVYRGKLILYGCGDFLNDYEGISGYGEFSRRPRP